MFKKLPPPTGPFHIGLIHLSFIDDNRVDTYFPATGEHPNIPVKIWYPIDEPDAKPKNTYLSEAQLNEIVMSSILRRLFRENFLRLESNSYKNCPVSKKQEKFPVVLFNHGGGVLMEIYSTKMELLASYGYIVVSIGHPYAGVLSYPDGTLITPDQSIQSIISNITDDTLPIEERRAFSRQFIEFTGNKNKTIFVCVDTIRFILGTLEKLNTGELQSIFQGKLNFENGIGIFGHSFGAPPSIYASGLDERISCAISMDGTMRGAFDPRAKFTKPSLYMVNKNAQGINKFFVEITSADSYYLKISGSNHMDFTDYIYAIPPSLNPFRSRKKRLKKATDLVKIIDGYLLAFFDKYLRNIDSDLLRTCPFPRCEFVVKYDS